MTVTTDSWLLTGVAPIGSLTESGDELLLEDGSSLLLEQGATGLVAMSATTTRISSGAASWV